MKALWILGFLLIVKTSIAQSYQFEKDNKAFHFLENPISINQGEVWGTFQQFYIELPFEFPFMDKKFHRITLECTGRIIFDASHFYYFDALVSSELKDKGLQKSLSPISYKVYPNKDSNILVIEIKNAGINNQANSLMNYQIHLHENGSIALHMGPSSAPETTFFSGAFQLKSFSPFTYQYGLTAFGKANHPNSITYQNEKAIKPFKRINEAPKEGIIYRYKQIPSP